MSPSELSHLLLDTKNAKLNIIKYRKDVENEIKRLETGVNNLRGKPQYNTAILKLQGQINILKSLLKVSLRRPTVSSGTLVLETRSTVSPLTTESTVELVPQQTLLPIQQEQKELLVIPTNKPYFDSLKTWNSWVENPRLLYLLYYNLSNFIPDQFKFTPTFLVKDNEKEEVTPINRSQLREKLRSNDYNPYDLSGSDRKILRKAYNGEVLLSEDSPLFNIFQLIKEYKKGGILFAKKGQKNSFASNLSNIAEKAKIKALQNRLYDLGAFGNISREKAVDGIMGSLTKKALDKVKLNTEDSTKETSNKTKQNTENNSQGSKRRNTLADMYSMTHAANTGGMSTVAKSFQEPENLNEDNGHVIYLHYPNFVGESKNAMKVGDTDLGEIIGDPKLPVGHAATILIDKDGNANYYEYGRYTTSNGHLIGKEQRSARKGGNWRHFKLPKQSAGENDSVYVARVQNILPYTNTGAYQAITIPSVDVKRATQFIEDLSNNPNRKEYGILNTCATGACNTVLPFRKNKKYNFWLGFNRKGYSSNARVWSMLPLTTDSYAVDARRAGSNIYIMNDKSNEDDKK